MLTTHLKGRPHSVYNQQNYMPNGAAGGSTGMTTNVGSLPSNGRVVQAAGARILCIADVRGQDHFATLTCLLWY